MGKGGEDKRDKIVGDEIFRACLVALLAWAPTVRQPSQSQESKIKRLGMLPGLGATWEARTKPALNPMRRKF